MKLPNHKTKIICTIGPAVRSLSTITEMVKSGMSVARLNFSHGQFAQHKKDIDQIRQVSKNLNQNIGILIDLPGAKIRVGDLKTPHIELKKGQQVVLTTEKTVTGDKRIPVDYKRLTESVSKGSLIYLNDGFLQLKVLNIKHSDVYCKVLIGGMLSSYKGLNLPGAKVFIESVTKRDLECVAFGLSQGVHVFGLSFVERAADIQKVRSFAKKLGKEVFIIAKIERIEAIKYFDEIVAEADGVMVARGDLGVEIPIAQVPIIQKQLIHKANLMGKPVITATQMLESMTENIRPTRAEVNDVANAILDGTDAIMLSEETAIGHYPVETVQMMSQVALLTETERDSGVLSNDESIVLRNQLSKRKLTITDVITLNVVRAAEELHARFILTPTSSGGTARRISRFKPKAWIIAFSPNPTSCAFLIFSYGTYPFLIKRSDRRHTEELLKIFKKSSISKKDEIVIITERRFSAKSGQTDSLSMIRIEK